MMTYQDVLADALWVIGLAGLLATVSYLQWYRQLNRWQWRHILVLPRARTPLALSLALISGGAALNGLLGKRLDPWWVVVGWCLLFILFLIQTVIFARAGDQHGWDSSTGGTIGNERS